MGTHQMYIYFGLQLLPHLRSCFARGRMIMEYRRCLLTRSPPSTTLDGRNFFLTMYTLLPLCSILVRFLQALNDFARVLTICFAGYLLSDFFDKASLAPPTIIIPVQALAQSHIPVPLKERAKSSGTSSSLIGAVSGHSAFRSWTVIHAGGGSYLNHTLMPEFSQ